METIPRIKSKALYLCSVPQGISGFSKPSIIGLTTGYKYRLEGGHRRCPSARLGQPLGTFGFRLRGFGHGIDGTILTLDQATEHLAENPSAMLELVPEKLAH